MSERSPQERSGNKKVGVALGVGVGFAIIAYSAVTGEIGFRTGMGAALAVAIGLLLDGNGERANSEDKEA